MDFEENILAIVISVIVVIITVVYLFLRRPPSFPNGPFIIKGLGIQPFVQTPSNFKELFDLLKNWKERYGKVVGFSPGSDYAILINDYDLAKELFIKGGEYVSDRPVTDRLMCTSPNYKNPGILAGHFSDPKWKQLHHAGQMGLHNMIEMPPSGRTTNKVEIKLGRYLDSLQASIGPSTSEPNAKTRSPIFQALVQLCHSIIFGGNRNQLKGKKKDFLTTNLEAVSSTYPDFLHLNNNFLNRLYEHYLGNPGELVTMHKKFQSYVFLAVGEHETRDKKGQISSHDFIDYYVKEYQKDIKEGEEEDNRVVLIVLEILEHGPELLCSTLEWVLYYMVGNPAIQTKIHEELSKIVGENNHPKLKDRDRLGLVDAVISECLRLSPPLPLGIPRRTCAKIRGDKYVLPKNTTVFLDVWNIHRDPKYWKNPENFLPERFLNNSGCYVHQSELIAFGLGRRLCIGEQVARQILFLMVANIFHEFNFKLPKGVLLPDEFSNSESAATFRPPSLPLIIEKRNKDGASNEETT